MDPSRATPGDPFAISDYAYANDNPYRYVDPDGKYACGSNAANFCTKVERFVDSMNKGLSKLDSSTQAYKDLKAVSDRIGKRDDSDKLVISPGKLSGSQIAVANDAEHMTIDAGKADAAARIFSPFNTGVSRSDLAAAFGAAAIAHEGQHQLDYVTPGLGYPTGRASEKATEVRAYRTEIGVPKGLGYSTDTYAPGALPKALEQRVQENAEASTNVFCKQNGC